MQKKSRLNKLKIIIFVFIFFFSFVKKINHSEFPTYRVVIDPGHGGLSISPRKIHGDRFDSISGKYLSNYQAGARYKNVEERIVTYSIAEKVKKILDLTEDERSFNTFKTKILKKISDENPNRVIIKTILSREKSLDSNWENIQDPNSGYRLFDFVDNDGNVIPGRISFINSCKPHLVVSLHCDLQAPAYYRGINPVIAAPYSLLHHGLGYLKGDIKNRNFYFNSPYRDWFTESIRRTGFKWFLKDVSVYFTGFSVDNKCRVQSDKFTGYRYNMVTWQYRDKDDWETVARNHPAGTQYAIKTKDFLIAGKFWAREQTKYEQYRRDNGPSGFGGDNLYASQEIIKFILFSLYQSGDYHNSQQLGKPYISVWSLPILVNAVTAYIELGYLKRKRDRFLLTKKQEEIAEGIAAGIYSLFAGLEPRKSKFKYSPEGEMLDIGKYKLPSGISYFDIVTP